MKISIVDEESGQVLAETGGPCQPCWETDLGLGPDLVELHAKTPSGDETYAWMFTLVE